MIKLKDIAIYAGVSEATASLVINNRKGVNQETRQKVLDAVTKLGYSPNSIARSLATKRTRTIGMVVTDIENPYFGSITRYIDEYVRKENYNLILSVTNDIPELEEKILEEFIRERVAGVVIVPVQFMKKDFSVFNQLNKHKIPYVFCTTYYPGMEADCVMADLEEGSYKLIRYLLDLGHQKILFLCSSNRDVPISKLRINGFRRALNEAKLDINESRIIECRKNDFYYGYQSVFQQLSQDYKPDAIVAINDIMALGAIKAVKEFGLSVPNDISVAGYDDVVFSSISDPALTTVKQNIPEICSQTVDMLMDKITGKQVFKNTQALIPELIIRKSTAKK